MFALYTDLLLKFRLGGIAIIIVNAALTYHLAYSTVTFFAIALVTIFLIFVWAFYINNLALKRIKTLHTDLLQNCRVREYLTAYTLLLQRPVAIRRQNIRKVLLCNMASGYDALGDHAQAIRLTMELLPIDTTKKRGQETRLIYCNNLSSYYLHAGDPDSASRAICDLKLALDGVENKNSANYLFCAANLIRLENLMVVERGEGEGVRKTLEIELANEKRQLGRLGLCQALAKIRLQAGDTAGATEYLCYMAENAGDSYHGPWAMAELQKINRMSHEKADT